uniref:Cyclin N-terminal domain-containing protein n=1 Tax=Elaeophora elaphi TaxID=1147741 RepID=A0A0R3RT90_9BILA
MAVSLLETGKLLTICYYLGCENQIMNREKRKRRTFRPKTASTSEPLIKYRRVTEENSRSAKIIENENRLSDGARSDPEPSTSAANAHLYNSHPSNFLSCGCLGSPEKVWKNLCESEDQDNLRKPLEWQKTEMHSIRARVTALFSMMQLSGYMGYRRETFHRAVDIFDRTMVKFDFEEVTKPEIIFIGIFAVFIACKLEERQENQWRSIEEYIRKVSPCDRLETDDMFMVELKIIASVNWSFRIITALEWAKIYAHMMRVYIIYKRIHNLSLAHQSTPIKKRTRIKAGVSDDEEVDILTWAQLDDLVIGEPSLPPDWSNRIALAQVLDLCLMNLYNFNFTYRQLGAAACISVFGLDYDIAVKITGLKVNELRPAVEFVNSHRRIYVKYVHKKGANLAATRVNKLVRHFRALKDDVEIEVVEHEDVAPKILGSTEKIEEKPLKSMKSEVKPQAPQLYPKKKDSHETHKISRITEKASGKIGMILEKQERSDASLKFKRKSSIFVSDSEVSMLEINVNSSNFRDISNEANIPKQQRLGILSPEGGNKEEVFNPMKALIKTMEKSIDGILPKKSFADFQVPQQLPVFRGVKRIQMECKCGCGRQDVIEDEIEFEQLIRSFIITHRRKDGTNKGKLFITKRNQRGEIETSQEISIPHHIETLEKHMAKYYTQSFPLETYTMMHVVKRLQRFWMEYGSRKPCKRRHSYSAPPQDSLAIGNRQRRKSE